MLSHSPTIRSPNNPYFHLYTSIHHFSDFFSSTNLKSVLILFINFFFFFFRLLLFFFTLFSRISQKFHPMLCGLCTYCSYRESEYTYRAVALNRQIKIIMIIITILLLSLLVLLLLLMRYSLDRNGEKNNEQWETNSENGKIKCLAYKNVRHCMIMFAGEWEYGSVLYMCLMHFFDHCNCNYALKYWMDWNWYGLTWLDLS